MSKKPGSQKSRFITLDHLRGFLIIVIIIDHLGRWPSILSGITGQGELWVTAAEGFVIISGLLVGYVRGYKNRSDTLKKVSLTLWRRALLLYVCSIIASIVYTALMWYAPIIGGIPLIQIEKGNWPELVLKTLTLQYTYLWVYFLTLYAVFLAASPLAMWLLRSGKAWLVVMLSLALFAVGRIFHIEVLQWQALFFIPSVAGYYIETIQRVWAGLRARAKRLIQATAWSATLATILLAVYFCFHTDPLAGVNLLFGHKNIGIAPLRLVLAFVWFIGFLLLFQAAQRLITRALGWLLIPFGTRSLSAYIIHGLVIIAISLLIPVSDSMIVNTILGISCVLAVWGLLKIPLVQKIIPT